MYLPNTQDTIVALATPPGIGAIGVIRLAGPQAIQIADRLFFGKKLSERPSHTAHFGQIKDPDTGRIVDEALVTIFKAPRSYTGDDVAELSCHGSPYILQEVIRVSLACGARLAQPGEFTLRAFLNGKLDLSQAEAVADLIASQTQAAADVALHQLRGGFRSDIQVLRTELIHFASLIELELDFSEEDVQFANRDDLRQLVEQLRSRLRPLIESFALGNAIKTGVTTVIAGRPNAGKSTLLNALLREERAIVSDIPGTTRDTIEEVLNIKGIQFRIIDTAGIREAQDQIEAIGVERTLEKVRSAALLIYVWDVASGMTLADVHADLAALVQEGTTQDNRSGVVVVCNKMDQNPYFDIAWLVQPDDPQVHPYLQTDPPAVNQIGLTKEQIIPVSAKNLQNIEYLTERMYELAVGADFSTNHTVVSNARHHDALLRADGALQDVLNSLQIGITGDFVAQDIRHALTYLGEITGEIGVEDLLGNIFGKFCIGK
jgi:tRNA modification GTPase